MPPKRVEVRFYADPTNPAGAFQSQFREKLQKYGVTQRAIADAMGMRENLVSRELAGNSPVTGKPVNLSQAKMVLYEAALLRVLAERDRERKKGKT